MKITFFGHSCFMIDTNGKRLLFDPFIVYNPLASHIDMEKIQPDYLLLSHAHQDHVADAEYFLANSAVKLISNYEIVSYYKSKGYENGWELNHGGGAMLDNGIQVKYTYAFHSSVFPDGAYGGNPGGFIIRDGNHTAFFSGDTSLSYDFKLIGDSEAIDVALLPIGGVFTMDMNDAAICGQFLKTDKVIGLHYNTFPPITIDKEVATNVFKDKSIDLLLLDIGTSYQII